MILRQSLKAQKVVIPGVLSADIFSDICHDLFSAFILA
jgi:hypothetical protein